MAMASLQLSTEAVDKVVEKRHVTAAVASKTWFFARLPIFWA
jgi:hypothetical protein